MERILKEKLPNGVFPEVDPAHQQVMKAVRGKGNQTTEGRFQAALTEAGITGWELHSKAIQGRPDFFFPRERMAVFVDGCFWHGCDKCGHIPKKNNAFWTAKISRNKERDAHTSAKIRRQGIAVLRFWEHEISESISRCISLLQKRMRQRCQQFGIPMVSPSCPDR
jgi:DNA mismatch endonuclease Vsr